MKVASVNLVDESASVKLAAVLAGALVTPLVLTFSGDIGAGKTTFIRAMLRALGVKTAIKSPTFSLVESYSCGEWLINHFDLYRIHDETELEYIGFRDYFLNNAVCCIEWPERAMQSLGFVDLNFKFAINGGGRLLSLQASSSAGELLLSYLVDKQ